MIEVSLIKKSEFGGLVEAGTMECRGVPIRQPDGGMRRPVQNGGQPVPLSVIQKPAMLLPNDQVEQILTDLQNGKCIGEVGEYQWRA